MGEDSLAGLGEVSLAGRFAASRAGWSSLTSHLLSPPWRTPAPVGAHTAARPTRSPARSRGGTRNDPAGSELPLPPAGVKARPAARRPDRRIPHPGGGGPCAPARFWGRNGSPKHVTL